MRGPVALLLLLVQPCWQRATIEDNGYDNVLIAISPQIAEDEALIDNLKEVMTRTSEELYRATRKQSYLRKVRILLPKAWEMSAERAVDETIDDAEFIVDTPNPAYGDNPFTVQNGDCGEPGDYTHLTPWFINNHDGDAYNIFGRTDKVLVHEWAKLRWGVFDEYGYPGDFKFPMFYYKTTWGPNGQQDVLAPNFCTSVEVTGVAKDITTDRQCTGLDSLTGMPDPNCFFIPDLDNQVKSSYMALPYLESVSDFCDDLSEENLHHDEIPTKQNLYCDGKSSWTVIMESEDFENGANSPVENQDTTPEFIIVKPPQNTRYALVMDVSFSMLAHPPDFSDRAGKMKDAAKRWIKYEVADGTEVSLVVFSDVIPEYDPVIYHKQSVNDETRNEMMEAIDSMVFRGKTCIGCGLDRALNWNGGIGDSDGGVIILITDGAQMCSTPTGCLFVQDMLPQLLTRKVRVVTVALGLSADPALEDVAVKTGGKSYYIDDSSGQGSLNDAFSGSLTYQPGDVLGNTNTVVHQKDFIGVSDGDKLKGFYDIDISIGREVTFEVNVKTKENECGQSLDFILVSPDDDQSYQSSFKCTPQDFGVYRHTIPDLSQAGRWIYQLTSHENLDSVSVKVESKSRDATTDPIMTKCWIAAGSQEIDTNVNVKLAVVAEVFQGTKPVIGAKVVAEIVRPPTADGTPQPPMELDLADNGSGADKIKNDGIYSRYFAKFTGKGRYSVKCQVRGDEETGVNGGWIGRRVYPQVHDPHNPLCCGSDALPPGSSVENTGNFTRQSSGGAFRVTNDVDPDIDNIPPGQVTDLKVVPVDNTIIQVSFTAPGDDLDSNDKAAEYIIKYSSTAGNLTGDNFDLQEFNTVIMAGNLVESDLLPVNGGSSKDFYLTTEIFEVDTKYVLAMRALDEAGNTGKVSNLVEIYLRSNAPTTSTTTTTTTTQQVPDDCDPGWTPGPGGCFSFYLYISYNWFDAKEVCESVGGWLAEPDTREKADFLADYVQQQVNNGVRSWWIGLTDRAQDNEWQWEHDQEDVSYTNWAPGYPSVSSNDCAIMDYNVNTKFMWSDTNCNSRFAAPICQR